MDLTSKELEQGLLAAARWLNPDFDSFRPQQRHELKEKLKSWLAPILATLPDETYADELLEPSGLHDDSLEAAAYHFRLSRMWETGLYDEMDEEEVAQLMDDDVLELDMMNLSFLTGVFLAELEGVAVPGAVPTIEALLSSGQDWQIAELF